MSQLTEGERRITSERSEYGNDHKIPALAIQMKRELDSVVVGNDDVKTAVVLGFLTGYPTLLIGDPGTAKTYTIEMASSMIDGIKPEELFLVLAHEAMTPEDVFGNINLKRLREEGVVEYMTEGFLPTAKVVFIDEIFKANKTLAESLFRAINEKKFRNGSKEVSLPWIGFFSASNEVRLESQADRAFLDRFRIFATTLSPDLQAQGLDQYAFKDVAKRYYDVIQSAPKTLPKLTSYHDVLAIQNALKSDFRKYISFDIVEYATSLASLLLNAINQAVQNGKIRDPSVLTFFQSMGGYLTISERKMKSIMEVANALRAMFGSPNVERGHVVLAFFLTLPFTPELRDVIRPIVVKELQSYSNSIHSQLGVSKDITKVLDRIKKTLAHYPVGNTDLASLVAKMVSTNNAVVDTARNVMKLIMTQAELPPPDSPDYRVYIDEQDKVLGKLEMIAKADINLPDTTNIDVMIHVATGLNDNLRRFIDVLRDLNELVNKLRGVRSKVYLKKLISAMSASLKQRVAEFTDVDIDDNTLRQVNTDLVELQKLDAGVEPPFISNLKIFFPELALELKKPPSGESARALIAQVQADVKAFDEKFPELKSVLQTLSKTAKEATS